MAEKENTDIEETTAIAFKLTPVTSKPKRAYRKGSKYDDLLDSFLKTPDPLVSLSVTGKDANYMRTQLNKRIEAVKRFSKMSVSVVNNKLYLEK